MEHCTGKYPPKEDYRVERSDDVESWAWAIAVYLDDYIEFHPGEEALRKAMAGTTHGQRALYACMWSRIIRRVNK